MTQNHNDKHQRQHNDRPSQTADNNKQPEEKAAEAAAEETSETETKDEASELREVKELLTKKEQELEKEKKEYLFLMAEFDNFRKRTLRERSDLIKNAAEKVLMGILPIVDDFERGLDAIRDSSDAEAVKEGMTLIYNKLVKYLSDNGVKVMETTGGDFDPELHEAVAMVPADAETAAGKIKDTVQKGYTLNDKVLRHAKVVVAQ